jgi:SulP family sulfate permease
LKINRILKYIPLIKTIGSYKREYAKKDLIASLTVAVVAIPQSMGYAIIAGVDPVYGLYTAIISVIIGSAFGSSSHLITGPTNAISLLIASSLRNYMGLDNAYEMLFLMTFIVGVMQLLLGVIKLGKVVNYVSHAVIVGFTAGAGVLIGLGQLNNLLGISIKNSAQMPTMDKLYYVVTHLSQTNLYALGLGILTIAIIVVCRKVNKNIPGSLLGIIIPSVIIVLFALDQQGVKLTGEMPASLPPFRLVQFNFESAKNVFSGAVAIACIGLVEAISISKSISSTSREKIDANQEFIGQGLANIVSSFFQCFPGSGSFTRSAVNYYSGAKTRLSGIFSGVLVAVVLLFLGSYAKYIANPCLAGVIIVIAYNMVDKNEMRKVSRVGRSDAVAMWITFGATVLMPDLDWAIYMGIAISIILYLRDTNKVPVSILVPSTKNEFRFVEKSIDSIKEKKDILIIQLEGNLYFGSAYDLETKLDILADKARVFILRMKEVLTVDITSLEALSKFIQCAKESGASIIICGVRSGVSKILVSSNFISEVGIENIFISEDEIFGSSVKAMERAKVILSGEAPITRSLE